MTTVLFDGSFDGLLTALFDAYELKLGAVRLENKQVYQPGLIDQRHEVITDSQKAARVWAGLKKKAGKIAGNLYTVFLSEDAQAHQHIFDYARYVFDNPEGAASNFGHPSVIAIHKTERSVSRERHRMKAFIRFERTADGVYYAPIEPDFNVLPLIVTFFRKRYADQQWIIYDVKRKYGVYYDLKTVEEVRFDMVDEKRRDESIFLAQDVLDGKEELYGLLWNDYFRSTNIPARKNMKLHLRHVPKRYWKYLTEKKYN